MFKNPDELKEFILWAKDQKIKEIKCSDVEVVFSDLALLSDEEAEQTQQVLKRLNNKPWAETTEVNPEEEEELLFWSSQS